MKGTPICNKCRVVLGNNNWYPSCKKKKEYLCKECKTEVLNNLTTNYKYQLERDDYSIKKSKRIFAPHIRVKKESDDILFKMLEDTEKYRIDKLIRILNGKETTSPTKEKIIVYLLRSYSLLSAKMIALVVNKANAMFVSKDTTHITMVQLANALKVCTLDNKMFKDGKPEIFEQMRTSKKIIEVDIPDL